MENLFTETVVFTKFVITYVLIMIEILNVSMILIYHWALDVRRIGPLTYSNWPSSGIVYALIISHLLLANGTHLA